MADGPSTTLASDVLQLILNGTTYTGPAGGLYIQLHTGAPGSAGTSNVATNNTRQSCGTFSGSNGAWSNASAINWTSVSTTETYSHMSLWTASTSGTFVGSGAVTGGAVTSGNNFQIPASDLTVTMTTAS